MEVATKLVEFTKKITPAEVSDATDVAKALVYSYPATNDDASLA